jgi:hypothetical protein
MKKYSSIINYQGNTNQNYSELYLTPVRMAIIYVKKKKTWCGGTHL